MELSVSGPERIRQSADPLRIPAGPTPLAPLASLYEPEFIF